VEDVISTRSAQREAERPGTKSSDPANGRRRSFPTALAVALGLLVGIAVAVLGPRLIDGDADVASDANISDRDAGQSDDGVADEPADDTPAPPGAGADTPEAAVTGFLDAEVMSDYESSFGFLSADDRRNYGSPAGWVVSHADVFAPILSYEVKEVASNEVVTEVVFEPGIDQVGGLTPGRAQITWDVILTAEDEWGISLKTSTVEPQYPSDEGAAGAAQQWVDARQACETPSNERSLIGASELSTSLCDASGSLIIGDVELLDDAEVARIFTAFGPEAASASRIVRVSGSVELGVVLAPIGVEWSVIGVFP
jgi:hypothetical protein